MEEFSRFASSAPGTTLGREPFSSPTKFNLYRQGELKLIVQSSWSPTREPGEEREERRAVLLKPCRMVFILAQPLLFFPCTTSEYEGIKIDACLLAMMLAGHTKPRLGDDLHHFSKSHAVVDSTVPRRALGHHSTMFERERERRARAKLHLSVLEKKRELCIFMQGGL